MPQMVQCSQGHFFDSQKHTSCPWCGVGPDPAGGGQAAGGKTQRMQSAASASTDTGSANPKPPSPGPAEGVTRRIVPKEEQAADFDPVVGWLVCVEGGDRGRDYRLRTAKNFIGRASSMDVTLGRDETVSRERHAVVAFDPQEKKFWVLPGDAQGLVYLNAKVVHTPTELAENDVISVGKSKLMFVPFCGERHQWE
jgi:hypothetical protein